MKIRHLLEDDVDREFFWESMQDHGWKLRGEFLVSPDDPDIAVDRARCLHYRGVSTGIYYTDADYAQLLRFERNPEVQATLCSRSYMLLRFASEAVQLVAVRRDWFAITSIENPSEALQLAAVRQSRYAIHYIENPSEAVQLAAVRQNGLAIAYIKNPSEAVQLAAVRQNGLAIANIKNPSEAVQELRRGRR